MAMVQPVSATGGCKDAVPIGVSTHDLNTTMFTPFRCSKPSAWGARWTVKSLCRRFLITVTLCLVGNWTSADEQSLESLYTSIKSTTCSKPPSSIAAAYDARGLSAQECPAPKGWRLFVVSSDERSWLEIARDHSLWSAEEEVVYRNEFGHFPNLGAERVEWRTTKSGVLSALIFRISAQDPNRPASGPGAMNLSRLFVIGLASRTPRFCGTAKTNQEARVIADNATTCVTMLKERALR